MDYQFENLGDERFQEFCSALIAKDFPNFQTLPVGQPDGGRDALVYLVEKSKKEFIVFQVKYVRNANQERDIHTWLSTTLKKEAPKIDRLIPAGAKSYYLLTNVRGTAHSEVGSIDKVNAILEEHIKIPAICWWRDDLSRMFEKDPLFKWSFPEILNGQDILNSLIFENLNENKERRSSVITAYLTDQFEIDREVKFKQIDLHNRLLALFTDVPLRVKTINAKNKRLQDTLEHVFNDTRGDQDENFLDNDANSIGAATFLLHSQTQNKIERILLEGGPGQGKSTISQYVCQVHRIRLLKKISDLELLTPEIRKTPLRLPFKIDLRDMAAWVEKRNPYLGKVPQEHFDATWRDALESFLVAHIHYHSKIEDFTSSDFLSICKHSAILLVFDGFDEIADLKSRAKVIEFIDKGINRIKANSKSIQVIITSRPAAFSDSVAFSTDSYPHFQLTDINPDIINEYVSKWVAAGKLDSRDSAELKRLVTEKLKLPHLKELAKSPMQLAIFISLLRTKGQSLPNKRTALFDNYISLFFDRESEKSELVRDNRELITNIHQYLAWVLHSEAELYKNSGSIELEVLTRRLNEYLVSEGHDSTITEKLFGVMKERVCALVSRVQGTFEFEVQPLREYFCAKYLYTTSRNSTAAVLRTGTKPDRFHAILRSPYWQNVVRFFAGCVDVGEMDMIIQELKDLQDDQLLRYTHYPRTITSQILSDYVFTQKPKKMLEVVKILVDGINIGNVINQTERARGGERLLLPNECGRSEVTNECFRRLADFPYSDYAFELIGIANNNYYQNLESWTSIAVSLDEPEKISKWLEYGYRLQLIHKIDANVLIELLSSAEGADVARRVQVVISGNRQKLFDDDPSLKKAAIDLVVSNRVHVIQRSKIDSAIGFLAAVLRPSIVKDIVRIAPRTLSLKNYLNMTADREADYDIFDFPCVDDIDKAVKKFSDEVSGILEDDLVDFSRNIAPWDDLVEAARSHFGENWNFCVMAAISGGMKYTIEIDERFSSLSDHALSLCKRARAARLKSGNIKYWSEQFISAPKLSLLLFFTWATPRAITHLLDEFVAAVNKLVDEDLIDLCRGVAITGEVSPLNEAQQREISALASNLTNLPELQFILTRRFRYDRGIKFIYEHVTQSNVRYGPINQNKLHYMVRAYLNNPTDKKLLQSIKSLYQSEYRFQERYYGSGYINTSMPLKIAEEVMQDCIRYPRVIGEFAEKSCRANANRHVSPVGRTAVAERWFDGE